MGVLLILLFLYEWCYCLKIVIVNKIICKSIFNFVVFRIKKVVMILIYKLMIMNLVFEKEFDSFLIFKVINI